MTPHGSAIRAIRKAQKMGIRTLEQLTGVNRGHLSRVERGEAGLSDEHIKQVADALNVPTPAITVPEEGQT